MTTKSPIGEGLRGPAASHAARVWTSPLRRRTASGVATSTGGPGDGDVNIEAPAMRAMHCQQRLLPKRSGKSGQGRMTKATKESRRTMTASDYQVERLDNNVVK